MTAAASTIASETIERRTIAKVSWRLPWVHRALELEAKVDYFHFQYLDFSLLTARNGANIEGGLNVLY